MNLCHRWCACGVWITAEGLRPLRVWDTAFGPRKIVVFLTNTSGNLGVYCWVCNTATLASPLELARHFAQFLAPCRAMLTKGRGLRSFEGMASERSTSGEKWLDSLQHIRICHDGFPRLQCSDGDWDQCYELHPGRDMAVADVLIWRRPGHPGQRPTPELFQPVVPLSFAQCGGSLLAFVTVDNKLYLMDSTSTSSPRLVEGLAEHVVIQVACSPQGFLVAITAAGAAYQVTSPAGLQERAQAGDPKAMALLSSGMLATFGRLQELPLPVSVVSCACGSQHTLLLSSEGLVFALGAGSQLGLGEVQRASSPVCIQALSHVQVSDIAAGTQHSLAVTSFGNLFTWGENQNGQLGDGTTIPRDTPGLLGEVLGAVCAAAQQASAAIAKDGQIFAWGFAGQVLPRAMSLFGRRAKALALTEELLVCCSTAGELIFMELQANDETWIAHDKVLHVSAADHHVVALCESTRAAEGTATAEGGATQTSCTDRVHQPALGTEPTPEPSNPRGPLSESQLWAAKERLERSLQELQAEHFLELCGLRSQVTEADERLVKMGVQLSEQQLQSSRQKEEEDLAHLRQELEVTRAALTAEAEDLATFHGPEAPALRNALQRLRLTQETLRETQRTLEMRDATLSLVCVSWVFMRLD
eukprot:s599_g7.t1